MTAVPSDPHANTKVQKPQGGDTLVIASGGQLVLEDGAKLYSAGVDVTDNLDPEPAASGTLTTTDATASQVVATYTPPVSSMMAIEVNFVARKVGGGEALSKRSTASFLVDDAGSVTLVGSVLTGSSHVTSGASTWAVAVDTDGAVIRAKVTGQASTSIDWNVAIEVAGSVP